MTLSAADASNTYSVIARLPVVEYSREFQPRAADELDLLPDGSAIAEMLSDYSVPTKPLAPPI